MVVIPIGEGIARGRMKKAFFGRRPRENGFVRGQARLRPGIRGLPVDLLHMGDYSARAGMVIYRDGMRLSCKRAWAMASLGDILKRPARRWAWLPLSALLAVAGCETVPETGRPQLIMLDSASEIEMGATAFQQIRQELDLIEEGPQADLLREIGGRIVAAAEPELRDRTFGELEWEFHLADSPELNAFVVPDGSVVFYRGMMDFLRNEDEVAAVMGHEVGHVVARHSAERVSQNVLIQTGLAGAQAALGSGDPSQRDPIMAALGLGAVVGVQLPYSRAHESEADEIGVILMHRAGYDPRAAVDVWERMDAEAAARPPEFLSTHPNPGRRADEIRRILPRVMGE